MKNERGFSIISVMIAMGIASTMFASMGQMGVMAAKMRQNSVNKEASRELVRNIKTVFRKKELCDCHFAGRSVNTIWNPPINITEVNLFNTTSGSCVTGPVLAAVGNNTDGVRVTRLALAQYTQITSGFHFAKFHVRTDVGGVSEEHKIQLGLDTRIVPTMAGPIMHIDGCSTGAERVDFRSGEVTHGDIIPEVPGFSKNECNVILSAEATNFGRRPGFPHQGTRTGGWADGGWWEDNHYGGVRSFFDPVTWEVTCRFGIKSHDDHWAPRWKDALCRYMVSCRR